MQASPSRELTSSSYSVDPSYSNEILSTYRHLGGDCTVEFQEKIDKWLDNELKTSLDEENVNEMKCHLLNFLSNPHEDTLRLDGIYLELLYPVIFQPPFTDRLKTLVIARCSTSEKCDSLEPVLEKISLFRRLTSLSLVESEIEALPESIYDLPNLNILELIDCSICASFDSIDAILRFNSLTNLQINDSVLFIPSSIRKWMNAILNPKVLGELNKELLFRGDIFNFLKLANEESSFMRTFSSIVNFKKGHLDENQVAFSLLHVNEEYLLAQARLEDVWRYAEYLTNSVWLLELLKRFAFQKAQSYSVNPIETYLAFFCSLQDVYASKIGHFPRMDYGWLNQEDLLEAQGYIRDHLGDQNALCDFLVNRNDWKEMLRFQYPIEYKEAVREGGACDRSLLQLTERFLNELSSRKEPPGPKSKRNRSVESNDEIPKSDAWDELFSRLSALSINQKN